MTSDLASMAADRALEAAQMGGSDIDLIVLATSTPDQTFPATATVVQARLGVAQGAAFDVQAAERSSRGDTSASKSSFL